MNDPATPQRDLTLRGGLQTAVGLAVTAACLVVTLNIVSIDDVIGAFSGFNVVYVAPAVAGLAFGYACRIWRWTILLNSRGWQVGFLAAAPAFLGSIALNNILPLRAGDVVRAVVFPRSIGVTKAHSTGTLIVERLIDLATLVACLLISVSLAPQLSVPDTVLDVAWVLGAAAAGGLVALVAGAARAARLARSAATRLRPDLLARAAELGATVLESIAGALTRRTAIATLGASAMVWIGESALFYFLALGFGIAFTPVLALFVMATATLATLAPSSPGYVGPFHLAAMIAMLSLGLESAAAAAYAVLAHFVLWVSTTLAGAAAILLRRDLFVASAPATDAHLTNKEGS